MGIGMAIVAALTMVHSVPLSVAGGWLACALAFALWSYGKFNRMRLADPQLPGMAEYRLCHRHPLYSALLWGALFLVQGGSEERRVGKECGSTGRSWWSHYH